MKRKLQVIISTSAASVLALSALAQLTPAPNKDGPEYKEGRMHHVQRADRLNGAAKASDLIGMTVNNYQNEKLGKVEDLAVDVESGRVVQVIVSTGGFIGIGDTLSAVPPSAFHHDVAQKVLHLEANKEKLQNAPKFEMSKWADYSNSNHLAQVYSHYGQKRTLGFIQTGDAVQDGQPNTAGAPNTISTRKADGTWDKDRVSSDGQRQWMIPAARLGQVQKASKLMGTPVNNLQDEKLGKVENFLVDLPSGRVVAIIVSSGGFLGMGDELSAVPPTALRFNTDRDTLQLDASKEMLSNAPHFKANQWPDFAQPTYAESVYRAYKVEPYFTSKPSAERDNTVQYIRDGDAPSDQDKSRTDVTQPDNTARNVRDRNDNSLTPLDQGNSKADVATTAQIRKEIVAGKNMSVNAKNVKIITKDGQVTLRGPVNSAEEKRLIGEIANRIARSENVSNQLEVKLTTTSNN
jgi:sporulation protein YlmC with PRC-barrel domain